VTDPSLPIEFRHPALIERIVRGAIEDDPVRLHGAIVAAIELHGLTPARDAIFTPALAAAAEHSPNARDLAAKAIHRHLA
jgi:hypothetical protein